MTGRDEVLGDRYHLVDRLVPVARGDDVLFVNPVSRRVLRKLDGETGCVGLPLMWALAIGVVAYLVLEILGM